MSTCEIDIRTQRRGPPKRRKCKIYRFNIRLLTFSLFFEIQFKLAHAWFARQLQLQLQHAQKRIANEPIMAGMQYR